MEDTIVSLQNYGDYYGGYGGDKPTTFKEKTFLQKTGAIVFGLVPLGLSASCVLAIDNDASWDSAREYTLIAQGLSASGWLLESFDIPFSGWFYFLSSSFLIDNTIKVYNANKASSSTNGNLLCQGANAFGLYRNISRLLAYKDEEGPGVATFEQKGDGNYY